MPAGKLVFSGMEFVKSSRCGSSVRISVWRGTNTGGSTGKKWGRYDFLYEQSDNCKEKSENMNKEESKIRLPSQKYKHVVCSGFWNYKWSEKHFGSRRAPSQITGSCTQTHGVVLDDYLVSPLSGNGRGWHTLHPSSGWRRTGRRRWLLARGGCGGQATSTDGSKRRGGDPYGGTPGDGHPGTWWSHKRLWFTLLKKTTEQNTVISVSTLKSLCDHMNLSTVSQTYIWETNSHIFKPQLQAWTNSCQVTLTVTCLWMHWYTQKVIMKGSGIRNSGAFVHS